jgi:hypothetical protein
MNSGSPLDRSTIFLSGFAPKRLNKMPKSLHTKAKRGLQEIWMADTEKDAVAALETFVET